MKLMTRMICLGLSLFCLGGCLLQPPRLVGRSFYYWKSTFELKPAESAALRDLKIKRVYLKFYDVVWQGKPAPVSELRVVTPFPKEVEIVPTVFITNQVLEQSSLEMMPDLATKMVQKLTRMCKQSKLSRVNELQLDCDWTKTTRAKYFSLLQLIKEQLAEQTELSVTIRLHQIKYPEQTGVPPVKRGMLMFYNMSALTDYDTSNSILDPKVGAAYLGRLKDYPLSLDVVLPIYSWGVIFQEKRFIGLVNGFAETDLQGVAFRKLTQHYYQVQEDIYLHQTQLYQGDTLRFEAATYQACLESAKLIKQQLKREKSVNLAFYHLDAMNLRRFKSAQLEKIFNTFN